VGGETRQKHPEKEKKSLGIGKNCRKKKTKKKKKHRKKQRGHEGLRNGERGREQH